MKVSASLCVLLLLLPLAHAYVNPAVQACQGAGFEYTVRQMADGSETGICKTPSGEEDAWSFYRSREKTALKGQQELLKGSELRKSTSNPSTDNPPEQLEKAASDASSVSSDLPRGASTSFDWRSNDGDWTTPIKDQGVCNSCWAFSSLATVETKANINLDDPTYDADLSEQDVISNNGLGSDCDGGDESDALTYMKNTGVVRESCMPYGGSMCDNGPDERLKISSFKLVSATQAALKTAVSSNGLVTVYLVTCDDFIGFSGAGVYSHTGSVYWDDTCWHDGGDGYEYLNMHSMALVGYNDASSYWIAKNSWGSSWGDGGYIKIAYNQSVTRFSTWWNAVINTDAGDSRILFIDGSYYPSGTDIATVPSVTSFSASSSYTRSDSPVTFSVNADAKSVKYLTSVVMNGTNLSGSLETGGAFTITNNPAIYGCSNMEGNCALKVTATDDAGKSGSSPTINVKIDDLNPRASNLSISNNNSYLRSDVSLTLTAAVADNNISTVTLNGHAMSLSAGRYRITSTPAGLACGEGPCLLTLSAVDGLGNTNDSLSRSFVVDDTAPSTADPSTNESAAIGVNKPIRLSITVMDNDGVVNVTARSATGTPMLMAREAGNATDGVYGLNTTAAALGISTTQTNHTITFTATDYAGNLNNAATVGLNVDVSVPRVWNAQADQRYVRSDEPINFTVLVNDSSLASVQLNGTRMDGDLSGGIFTTINTTAQFGCQGFEGDCVFVISANDDVGNDNNSERITIHVDDLNPRVVNISINDTDGAVRSTQAVRITANVTDRNVTSVKINGTSFAFSNGLYRLTSNLSVLGCLPNALCTLAVVAMDGAGNVNSTETFQAIVDDTAPAVVVSMSNNTQVNGTINITADASDASGIRSVALAIDGTIYASLNASPFTFAYPTVLKSDGLYLAMFTATDNVGLSSNASVTLNFTNDVPVVVATSGDASAGNASIELSDVANTPVEGVIYAIDGLNSTSITIALLQTTSRSPSSKQLSTVLGRINISASTNSTSRIYLLIPKSALASRSLSAPYNSVAFYADHGSGVVGPLTSDYDTSLTLDGVAYERFWFQTTQFSTFYWGVQGTTSTPHSGGGGGGGGGGAPPVANLSMGTLSTILSPAGSYSFWLDNRTYTVQVLSMSASLVALSFKPATATTELGLGENATLDVTGDHTDDIVVKILSLTNTSARLQLSKAPLDAPVAKLVRNETARVPTAQNLASNLSAKQNMTRQQNTTQPPPNNTDVPRPPNSSTVLPPPTAPSLNSRVSVWVLTLLAAVILFVLVSWYVLRKKTA
jgi:hypothetical protein